MLGAKSKHKPDVKTYRSLMCNYARAGEVEKMERSLSRMGAANYKTDLITFEILIMGYGHVGAFNKMRGCVDRMLDLDIRPELTTLNALISAYCDHSLFDEAEALLNKAKDWHIQPEVSSYVLILRYSVALIDVIAAIFFLSMDSSVLAMSSAFWLVAAVMEDKMTVL